MPKSKLDLLFTAKDNLLRSLDHLQTVNTLEKPTAVDLPAVRCALTTCRGATAALQALEQNLLGVVVKNGD